MTVAVGAARLAFGLDEYRSRLEAIRAAMEERDVTLLLVDQAEHVGYISGYCPRGTLYQACVIPLDGEPVMVTRSVDEATFREVCWFSGQYGYGDDEDPADTIARLVTERGWRPKRIGVETDSNFLSVDRYRSLQQALSPAALVDCGGLIRSLRWTKSQPEIDRIREAARIADAALASVRRAARPGSTERDLAIAAYETALRRGADNSWLSIISARPGAVHGDVSDRTLEDRDVIHVELVPQVRGYTGRLMRPIVLTEASARQHDVARALIDVQDQQLAAMRPGVVARDIDRIAREGILRAHLRTRYDNVTGYTIGYLPGIGTPRTSDFSRAFLPSALWRLEAGMVFHMYVLAEFLAFSETVVVTSDGIERLTRSPRELMVQ